MVMKRRQVKTNTHRKNLLFIFGWERGQWSLSPGDTEREDAN